MFKVFANAFKVKDIRKKIFYVLFVVAIYRLGSSIPLPGIDVSTWMGLKGASAGEFSLQTLLGGGMGTIFAMGISPYITSSIIMQLLTVAIPKLEQMQKEGQDGRDKIQGITRYVAVGLALVQSAGMVFTLTHQQSSKAFQNADGTFGTEVINMFRHQNMFIYAMAVLTLVSGTMLVMWLSEMLDQKGFGNGTSFIIFANILSSLPGQIIGLITNVTNASGFAMVLRIAILVLSVILFFAIMAFAVLIQEGERRIPVQYSKKMTGRQLVGGQSSYIPLKVNIAGVMSIIFAVSLIQTPQIINGFVQSQWLTKVVEALNFTKPIGAIVYVALIFAFTFFYTSFAINPNEMAENIKKNGGFIPGIRAGRPTSEYIEKTVDRLSGIGAVFYAIIAMTPIILQIVFKVPVGFSGTTLLIVSSVALEIVKQLESLLLMKHYKGFLS